MIANEDITFVIQGPIEREITQKSVDSVKRVFPGARVILSTWKQQPISITGVDLVLENEDPGPTLARFSKHDEAFYTNVNRQIVSTLEGLRCVNTKYAVKLRADCSLVKNEVLELYQRFDAYQEKYKLLSNRVVCSNLYGKEFTKGLSIPYLVSDFFYFGQTRDLLELWDIPLFEDYVFNPELKGKRQHPNWPNRHTHVEQELWLAFVNKKHPLRLEDEYGTKSDNQQSRALIANNIVICDRERLGLVVPERHQQKDKFPYEHYAFERWKWLYNNYADGNSDVSFLFKLKWSLGRVFAYITQGFRLDLKLRFFRLIGK